MPSPRFFLNNTILKLFLLCAACLLATHADANWIADPATSDTGIRKPIFTWTGDPSSSLNVIWLDRKDSPIEKLSYQARGETNKHTAEIERTSFSPDGEIQACLVQLDDLKANTIYEFAFGDQTYAMSTLPTERPESIRFIAGGDMMHTPELMKGGTQAMASTDPAFALLGGDLAYANGKVWKKWLNWFELWADEAVTSEGLSIPAVVGIGNHEVDGGYHKTPAEASFFYALFPFPREKKAYYTIDLFDDLAVVVLDSNHTASVAEQTEWLESELAQRRDYRHLFALYHFPAYGVMKKGLNAQHSKDIREQWTPLFDQYGLDAAFENDHHIYHRSALIKDGKRDDTGTLYIGGGAWGVHTRKIPAGDFWYIDESSPTNHVVEVLIENDRRTYRAIDHNQQVFDEYVDARDAN